MSALICSGQLTRNEAIEEIEKPPATKEVIDHDREYVIKKLGLTDNEFDEIMKAPNKTYQNYPNNEKIWQRFDWFVKYARQRIIRVG